MEALTILKTSEDHEIKFLYSKEEHHRDFVEVSLTEEEHFALVNNRTDSKAGILTYIRPKQVSTTVLDNGSAKMVIDMVAKIMEAKNTIVRNQAYEHASHLRDAEKTLYRQLEGAVALCDERIAELELKYGKK